MNRTVLAVFFALAACSDPGGGGGGAFTSDGIVFSDAGDGSGPGDAGATGGDTLASGATGTETRVGDAGSSPDSGDAATVCSPGELRCDGAMVARCRADGSDFEPVETCGDGQVCADGQCLACYPSQRRCTEAGAAEECTLFGAWTLKQDCRSDGLSCVAGTCVSPCVRDPKANSNSGCDYWSVDMDNHIGAQDSPFAVIVSNLSPQTARVTVTRKDGGTTPAAEVLERVVAPGELSIFELPNRNMGAAGVFWTAYRIESTVPIIAYQFNPLDNVDVFSNDASLLIPSNTFGKEYFVMSRFELQGQGLTAGTIIPYRGELSVVATEPQTAVTVVPTCRTQAGTNMATMMAGQSYTYTLDPYQVLNIKSNEDGGDLTGSIVTSDKPVAVFGGHEAALSSTTCCADHLEHQLYPVSTWGTTYVATKSRARSSENDYWRFIAAEDGTTLSFAPAVSPPRTLNRGQWFELSTPQDFVVSADKPISVGQILASSGEVVTPAAYSDCTTTNICAPGYSCEMFDWFTGEAMCFPPYCTPGFSTCPSGHVCTDYGDGTAACTAVGDPTLIMLPPTKQFRKDYVFLSPNKYAQDFINLVAPSDASVTLDGSLVPAGNFTAVTGSSWKVARVGVGDGAHKVVANQPISVIAYGYDRDVSYGYAAGLNLLEE